MAFDPAVDCVSLPIIFINGVTAFWVFICHLVGSDAQPPIIHDPFVSIVIAGRRLVWDCPRITWFDIRLNCLCVDFTRAVDSTG
jgi:hypothetical protein